jgi:hypothetical protein
VLLGAGLSTRNFSHAYAPLGISAVSANKRPPLITTVGVIGIVAGIFPLVELAAILASARFAAWFLPLVRSILPVSGSVAVAVIGTVAVADLAFGIGVLTAKRWAFYGMILRSVIGVPVDYLNFTAGNRAGALLGLAVNVFIVWALLRSASRMWFSAAQAA